MVSLSMIFGDARLPTNFWSKGSIDDETGCWLWHGATSSNGYGAFRIHGRQDTVHRISYRTFVDPDLPKRPLDHLCRVRNCFNPRHLELVTSRTNVLRGVGITAENAKKTHCLRGHEFTQDNLVPSRLKKGHRDCLTCSRAQSRRAATEQYSLVRAAFTALGLTQREYLTTYGASKAAALQVIEENGGI